MGKSWAASIRRLGQTTALLLVFVIVLVGCGAPTAESPPAQGSAASGSADADEPVTIKFMIWAEAIGSLDDLQANLLGPFQAAHPNITVEVELLPWGEYWTKLQTLIAAGTPPDVYGQSVGYAWDHANRNISMNVQAYFDRDLDSDAYLMKLFETMRYPTTSGELHAIPFRWVNSALFYNKTLFDEAGLAYPDENWTFDDVLNAAKALTKDTDGDGRIDQWGVNATMNHVMLDTVIKANGGEVLNADFTQCQLTQPASLEAIQWVVDLVQEHGVAPNPTLAAQADTAPTFASGRIAMALDGSYQIASLQEVTAFDWDITLVPSGDSKRVVYGGPDSLSIAQRSSNPEAAWTFVKFFLSEDVGMKSFGAGSIPVNRALAGSDAWLTSVSKPANYGLLVEQEPYVVGADFGPSWIQWRVEAMNRELESAILGTRPVAEAAAAACGEIDAILAKVERK